MIIRLGTEQDIPAAQKIAHQFSDMLDFVRSDTLQRHINKGSFLVAELDDQVVGFIHYNPRKDGVNKIYDIAVDKDRQASGVGRALLYAVPCPMRLKVTTDNDRANRFYRNAGMKLVATEPGRIRALNIYEMNILSIIVRGSSKEVPLICRLSGSAYGSMEKDIPYEYPFMLDVDFTKVCWWKYARKIKQYHPVQALVVDYMSPDKRLTMLAQVRRLNRLGVLRIVVCPKFHGAISDIPMDCIVGVSLRTDGRLTTGVNKFVGFMPNFIDLVGRKVHLLGGSPDLQIDTIVKLQGIGATVISLDGNAQFRSAEMSSVWRDAKWKRIPGVKIPRLEGALASSQNIQRAVNGLNTFKQLELPLIGEGR